MKKLMFGTLVAVTLMATFHLPLSAAGVPPVISYQGKLMQPSGAPVPDGTVSIVFSIYDVPIGGTALWTETNNSIQVKGGLFSAMLGSVAPIPTAVFAGPDRYFGIKVGADSETSPRQKIASTAYSQTAGSAETARVADNGTPVGGIIMWSGAAIAIPTGWKLCDGTNGTPNLRDKFIVGAGSGYAVGASGGAPSITLSVAQLPPHSHGVNDPGHAHVFDSRFGWGEGAPDPGHPRADSNSPQIPWETGIVLPNTTGISIQNAGSGQSVNTLPPYYALCFIMKVAN